MIIAPQVSRLSYGTSGHAQIVPNFSIRTHVQRTHLSCRFGAGYRGDSEVVEGEFHTTVGVLPRVVIERHLEADGLCFVRVAPCVTSQDLWGKRGYMEVARERLRGQLDSVSCESVRSGATGRQVTEREERAAAPGPRSPSRPVLSSHVSRLSASLLAARSRDA